MTWPIRDDDRDGGFERHARRFVCETCKKIILWKGDLVRRGKRVLCSDCAFKEMASAS